MNAVSKDDAPDCFGTFDEKDKSCTPRKCDWVDVCKRRTGYLRWKEAGGQRTANPRTAGLSRTKAMKAMCFECQGGTNRGPDCLGAACPLYPWMKQGELEPNLWWMGPVPSWNEASQLARGAKTILGNSEEDDDGEDYDDE